MIAEAPLHWFEQGGIAHTDAGYRRLKEHFRRVMTAALIAHFPWCVQRICLRTIVIICHFKSITFYPLPTLQRIAIAAQRLA